MSRPRVLVTGATGYIGARLARRLSAEGWEVTALVRKGRAPEGLPSVQGDVRDPVSLLRAFQGADVVCHSAGMLGKWGVPYEEIRAVNVDGAQNVIWAAHAAKVGYVLHLSTSGVTGPRDEVPANEETACAPYTEYERTKHEGEQAVRTLSRELGVRCAVVRPTFTYGPDDPHKLGLFKAIRRGVFFYMGDGSSTTHPVYIDDLLTGIMRVLERRPSDRVYILGGARPVTKRELATTIARELGVKEPWLRVPVPAAWALGTALEITGRVARREPPLTRSRVLAMSRCWGQDIARAREELGYEPQVELSEGIRRTVESYRKLGWLS